MDEEQLNRIIEAVETLCARHGLPPSVAQVAEEAGYESAGSVYYYLRIAVERGRIANRNKKFMSLDMAQAWPVQKGK